MNIIISIIAIIGSIVLIMIGISIGMNIPNKLIKLEKNHRRSVSHSIIPIGVLVLLGISSKIVILKLLIIGISIGYAIHLIADLSGFNKKLEEIQRSVFYFFMLKFKERRIKK